jgi:hypothetical protein
VVCCVCALFFVFLNTMLSIFHELLGTSTARHTKNPTKILGEKNSRSRKTKITHQSPQLHIYLIYLHCATN